MRAFKNQGLTNVSSELNSPMGVLNNAQQGDGPKKRPSIP